MLGLSYRRRSNQLNEKRLKIWSQTAELVPLIECRYKQRYSKLYYAPEVFKKKSKHGYFSKRQSIRVTEIEGTR